MRREKQPRYPAPGVSSSTTFSQAELSDCSRRRPRGSVRTMRSACSRQQDQFAGAGAVCVEPDQPQRQADFHHGEDRSPATRRSARSAAPSGRTCRDGAKQDGRPRGDRLRCGTITASNRSALEFRVWHDRGVAWPAGWQQQLGSGQGAVQDRLVGISFRRASWCAGWVRRDRDEASYGRLVSLRGDRVAQGGATGEATAARWLPSAWNAI